MSPVLRSQKNAADRLWNFYEIRIDEVPEIAVEIVDTGAALPCRATAGYAAAFGGYLDASMKAVICGGGIGGLTAALCFNRAGAEVTVLEQAPELGEIGAGIQLSPNGMKVLEALGVADAVASRAFEPQRIEMRGGRSGRLIFSIPLAEEAVSRWGAPYLHVHRADLIDALAEALRARAPGAVRTGAEVAGYRQTGERAAAVLSDGTAVEGDVVVGADGIHSALRAQMLGPETPDFTGNVAWRAVVPVDRLGDDVPPPTACVWVGKGRHAVTYRLRNGTLANFVGVVERDDWRNESWTEPGRREDVLKDFDGWHRVIRTLIEQADTHYRWALFDRRPLKRWSDGCVTLLGDACHPMLPFLAQGAVMAIEDAWVLAETVRTGKSVTAALQAYQNARLERTAKVQAGARANAKTFHKSTLGERFLTYVPMWLAAKIRPEIVHARQDWLYGFDAVQTHAAVSSS